MPIAGHLGRTADLSLRARLCCQRRAPCANDDAGDRQLGPCHRRREAAIWRVSLLATSNPVTLRARVQRANPSMQYCCALLLKCPVAPALWSWHQRSNNPHPKRNPSVLSHFPRTPAAPRTTVPHPPSRWRTPQRMRLRPLA